jgi:hypothetical protein
MAARPGEDATAKTDLTNRAFRPLVSLRLHDRFVCTALVIAAVLLATRQSAADQIGIISDASPPTIKIIIDKSGTLSEVGPGAAVELGDRLSIQGWCRTQNANGLVVVNTRFGEQRLDCNNQELIFTDRGPLIPPQPTNYPRTVPTITAELGNTISGIEHAYALASKRSANADEVAARNPAMRSIDVHQAAKDAEALSKSVAASCVRLRSLRDAIYTASGYCSNESRAVAGANQCRYSSEATVPLPAEVRQVVARSVAAERAYCR